MQRRAIEPRARWDQLGTDRRREGMQVATSHTQAGAGGRFFRRNSLASVLPISACLMELSGPAEFSASPTVVAGFAASVRDGRAVLGDSAGDSAGDSGVVLGAAMCGISASY